MQKIEAAGDSLECVAMRSGLTHHPSHLFGMDGKSFYLLLSQWPYLTAYKDKKVPRPNDSFAQSINGIGILKEYACESTYKSYINGRFIFKHNRFISSKFVSKAV